jgi:5-(carboxyamino)imidazole ribonucleotide synthase
MKTVKDFLRQKIGILGGGQLGKMLCQSGSRWGLDMHVLDHDPTFPAGQVNPHFVIGDFNNEEDVFSFGIDKDVITIEIEHVAVSALERLQQEGVAVYPDPSVLRIIQDKGEQKQFFTRHGLPTSPFRLYPDKQAIIEAIANGSELLPFVQKTRTAGYDGRGVAVINAQNELEKLLEGPSIIEDLITMQREVAVIVARDVKGGIRAFPAVEMRFNMDANLVEMLLCPANLTPAQEEEAQALAIEVASIFQTVGLLAVEMFQTPDGHFLVNEVAPRPHNSGHHTIECCDISQYDQHLRAITGLPLGEPILNRPGVMINILGEPGYAGAPIYSGWEACLQIPGVHMHLYGKSETRPYRKMGHVTITSDTLEEAIQKAERVQNTLKVIA